MCLSIIPPSPCLLKCHALLRRLVGDRIVIFPQPSQFQPSAKLSTARFCQRRFLWTLHDHLVNLIFSGESETDKHFIYNYANAPTCAHWAFGKRKVNFELYFPYSVLLSEFILPCRHTTLL